MIIKVEKLIERHGETMEFISFEKLIEEMCGVSFDEVYPKLENNKNEQQGNME